MKKNLLIREDFNARIECEGIIIWGDDRDEIKRSKDRIINIKKSSERGKGERMRYFK